jgi:hypothetical protein
MSQTPARACLYSATPRCAARTCLAEVLLEAGQHQGHRKIGPEIREGGKRDRLAPAHVHSTIPET